MAGPLQPVPGFNPGAGAGLPSLHPLVNALLNVATLGEHTHPGSLAAYGSAVAHSMNPRTPAGAFNLATILVPGAGKGRATAEQGNLLRSISSETQGGGKVGGRLRGSERKVTNSMGTWNVWNPNDPATAALAELIGGPAKGPSQRVYEGQLTANNPWAGLGSFRRNLSPRLGLSHDRGADAARGFMGLMEAGDLASHAKWVDQLILKNAIQRRN